VSGDYFDVFPLGDHKLCICIADVVGKGVSAALLMAHAQAAVRALSNESESPASLCMRANRLLCET
jgi:sigma-B regulation protein RsbU (phosphoserine phosphatase)